ncbi:MAG: sulfatase-like hydrolase/transferase [Lentimicrobium sp.]|jgi:arylsulfatase A-like enzyme|nr:sulfatase-like hydrolase/transferase [Lentimicrobium sp.]
MQKEIPIYISLCSIALNVNAIEKPKKYNILFIQADQHRYDCIGYSGVSKALTPNLDKLASESFRFTNSFSCIPTSCPARQSLLTGLWPEKHKGLWNYDITLPVTLFNERTWTQELAESGVQLGYVGKWHVHPTKTPLDFGFSRYISEWSYDQWRKTNNILKYTQDSIWAMGGSDPAKLEDTRTHWLANKAIQLIKEFSDNGTPWHVRLETSDPHLPCYPVQQYLEMYNPEEIPEWGNFRDKFKNKPYIQKQQILNWNLENMKWKSWQTYIQRYYANITQLDDAIGKVINALKEMGIYDNTIIVYTSDHGDMAGSHNMLDKHYVMYEEVVRVPLLVRIPNSKISPGKIKSFVNNQIDFAATMTDYYGLTHKTQGASLMPFFELDESEVKWREYAFSNYNGQQFGLFVMRMIRDKKLKYVWNMTDVDELYDLEKDPFELKNHIKNKKYKKDLVRLRKELFEDLRRRQDPLVWQAGVRRQLLDNIKN